MKSSVTSSISGPIRSLRSSPNYKYWVYGAVAIGLWINVTDQSGINIALPEIAEEFTADIPTVQWITLGYSLATSAMLMPMGRLSDMFGRKLVYLLGFVMFSVMALVGGLSRSLGFLIAVKIVQGLGSAGIQANSMALITEVFPDRERGKAMGMYMAIIGTGAVSGPMAGGILISYLGWRSIFFAVLSVAILSMICTALVLKGRTAEQASPRGKRTFDWMGAVLSSAALVAFLLAMTNAWKLGWTSLPIAGGLAASLVLVVGFIVWEMRAADPMLDMSLFRSRVFSLAISARFLSFLGGSAVFFLMPFYLIQGLGYEANRAALLIIPGSLCMAVIGPLSGRLSDQVGTRWPAAVGMVSSAASMFVLSALSTGSPAWHVILGMILSGFGHGGFQLSKHQRDNELAVAEQVRNSLGLREPDPHVRERVRDGAGGDAGNDHHGVLRIRAKPIGGGRGQWRGRSAGVRDGDEPRFPSVGRADAVRAGADRSQSRQGNDSPTVAAARTSAGSRRGDRLNVGVSSALYFDQDTIAVRGGSN